MKKWSILFAIVLLSACAAPVLHTDEFAPGEVMWQESFDDPESGWEQIAKTVGSSDYFNGTYRIIVNQPNYDLWATAPYELADVRLEVDAARFGGPEDGRFGLICRYVDAQNFYFFVITSDGYTGIGRTRAGAVDLLDGNMMQYSAQIVPGVAPNHLRFDCVGEKLTGYVNGTIVSTVNDLSFEVGKVGLLAGAFDSAGVDVIFDTLQVIKP